MNETTILSVEQTLGCKPQQEGLYVAYKSIPVVRTIEVFSEAKFTRSFKVYSTVYLGFFQGDNGGVTEPYASSCSWN